MGYTDSTNIDGDNAHDDDSVPVRGTDEPCDPADVYKECTTPRARGVALLNRPS